MATQLSELKPGEISFVPEGANKKRYAIVKEDEMAGKEAFEKALKDAGYTASLPEKIAKALEPMMKELSDKAKAAVDSALKILSSVKDEIPEDAMAALMAAGGVGANPVPPPVVKDDCGDMAPVQKEDGSWDYSNVPEGSRKLVQSIWKERLENAKRVEQVEKELKAERDARVTKEFQEKAGEFKHLGIAKEELAVVLKDVSQNAPKAFEKLEPILKALDGKIAKSGILGEIGSSAPAGGNGAAPEAGQTDAEAKIEQIAKGLVEKSEGKLTKAQAIAKAWDQNKNLYAEHRAQKDAERRK